MKRLVMIMFALLVSTVAMAQDAVPNMDPSDFMQQVLAFIKSFGGLSMVLKIAGVIAIVISTMKVSFLNQMIWSKLGKAKVWVAPILGLAYGILMLSVDGAHITLAAVTAYLASGGGAVFVHEILDSIKGIPGLGQAYINMIDFLEKVLGGPASEKYIKVSRPQ